MMNVTYDHKHLNAAIPWWPVTSLGPQRSNLMKIRLTDALDQSPCDKAILAIAINGCL